MIVVIPVFENPSELADETLHVSEGGRLVIGAWAGSVNPAASTCSVIPLIIYASVIPLFHV